jgi:hypothetical protein
MKKWVMQEIWNTKPSEITNNDQQERVLQPVFHLDTEYSQVNNLDKVLELYA